MRYPHGDWYVRFQEVARGLFHFFGMSHYYTNEGAGYQRGLCGRGRQRFAGIILEIFVASKLQGGPKQCPHCEKILARLEKKWEATPEEERIYKFPLPQGGV